MNRIKIVHVITDLKFGGAGRYLLEICRYIDKERFENIVILPKGSILNSYIGQIQDVRIIEINGIGGKSFDIKGVKELYHLLKNIRPDVVHTHACFSARISATLLGVNKVLYTRHGLQAIRGGLKGFIKRFMNRIFPNKAIAVSKAVFNNLVMEGVKEENIYLIYNGVNIPNASYNKDELRRKYGLSKDEIVITLVGRLDTIKGQEHLLNITEILKTKASNFAVVLAGDGINRQVLEASARDRDLPVKFLGHIREIHEVYVLSDIIVNTSNSEALSFAALEGFSHKKPVVAFDLDGINEVIDHGVDGYLVEFRDYKAFANRLIQLMEDEDLRIGFGEMGYKKVASKFSIEEMVKKIEDIYGGIE